MNNTTPSKKAVTPEDPYFVESFWDHSRMKGIWQIRCLVKNGEVEFDTKEAAKARCTELNELYAARMAAKD